MSRNEAIAQAARKGIPLKIIAHQHGISVARVSQIIHARPSRSLAIELPKGLRLQLYAEARRRSIEPRRLVAALVADALGGPVEEERELTGA